MPVTWANIVFLKVTAAASLGTEFEHYIFIYYLYLNSDSLFCIFVIPFSPFNIYLLLIMCIRWSVNLIETSFESLGSIPIFDVSLLANLPISSIFSFK